MKPVEQDRFGEEGNCHAACIASIFEVPLREVPQPSREEMASPEGWHEYETRLQTEFFYPRGFHAATFALQEGELQAIESVEAYSILSVEAHGGTGAHAVVCRGGEIVWNPDPLGTTSTGTPIDWTVFLSLDPAKQKEQSI